MKTEGEKMFKMIIGLILGTVIGLVSTTVYDNIKEKRERLNLSKMVYIDVQNNLTTLYTMLQKVPYDEAIKHDFINANDFDTRIFESYLQKIPLLSLVDAARILSFYGELTKANEAMHILKDKNLDLSRDSRLHWITFFL